MYGIAKRDAKERKQPSFIMKHTVRKHPSCLYVIHAIIMIYTVSQIRL